ISAVEVQRPRGVPLSRPFYEEGKPFTCLDGSRTIPFNRVNDDYCDCQDGSDEPTSACPNGHFHCTNAGFRPAFIPSSRVNDGICCCDTTDEYNSGATCQNTCEMGRKEKEIFQKLAEVAKEGFLLKQQLIQEAKRGLEEKKAKLAEVEVSKKDIEAKVESLRTVKEEAEKPEKEAKERHLKAWEQKAVIRMEKDKAKMAEVFAELDDDADGVSVAELLTHSELDPDSDGSFTEVEAQVLLGVEKVDIAAFEAVWSNIKDKYISEAKQDIPIDPPQEENKEPPADTDSEQYPDEDIPEEDDDEEDDEDDEESPPTTHTQEKKADEDDEEGAMPPYDEETQQLIDAQKARDEFDEAERALREVDDQINIEKEISFDFGPSAEFGYMYSQCYELTTGYVYKLCPFNRVSQKPKFGGSETNLTWGKWAGPEDNIYSVMKYEHGTGCWQGPNRSTTVKLTCGNETVITATSEPSRCEYLMEFTTPAICNQPKNMDLTDEHDEL
uniref:Glucosidase 2 subunit beta n=1 Tax=Periophthalmus magnuspinnatus TaxID=409849 RepID=A0A3B3ZCH4_9GOBI